MSRLLVFATALVLLLSAAAGREELSPTSPEIAFRLAVPRALPLLGQEQILVARITYHGEATREATVSFRYRSQDDGGQLGPGSLRNAGAGEIPTYAALTFDQIGFSVKCGASSKLQWDADHQAMFLHGAATKPVYALGGYVDNLEVNCFE